LLFTTQAVERLKLNRRVVLKEELNIVLISMTYLPVDVTSLLVSIISVFVTIGGNSMD
jgi:hypothetical protein